MRASATKTRRSFDQLATAITGLWGGCACEIRTEPLQLRVNVGVLVLSVIEDDRAPGHFALIRVKPNGDFLDSHLVPVEVVAEVAALLRKGEAMEDQFKVCGNCGHCTMIGGEYVCIDPARLTQERVPMGARHPCFVVTLLTPKQLEAAALAPVESIAIN